MSSSSEIANRDAENTGCALYLANPAYTALYNAEMAVYQASRSASLAARSAKDAASFAKDAARDAKQTAYYAAHAALRAQYVAEVAAEQAALYPVEHAAAVIVIAQVEITKHMNADQCFITLGYL